MQISPCACHHLAMLCCCSLPAMEVYISSSGAQYTPIVPRTAAWQYPAPAMGVCLAQYTQNIAKQIWGFIYCSVTASYGSIHWHLPHLHYCKHQHQLCLPTGHICKVGLGACSQLAWHASVVLPSGLYTANYLL